MTRRPLTTSSLWLCHIICCALALLACVPILWPQVFLPDAWEARIISYAGWVLLLSAGFSLLLIAATSFLLLLRLRNMRALGNLLIWAGLWLGATLLYTLLAALANVPPPGDTLAEEGLIQRSDKLYIPEESLTGPDSLVIPIEPEHYPADSLVLAPHLTLLEEKHSELLRAYIDSSPRWASYTADDTFYTKPGHVVMIPPQQGGIPGLVHASFRRLVEGDPLPAGYTIVKPGATMPATPEGSEQVPDLAVDLGGSHYLLLAWRGTSHAETAHRALNAALAMVNDIVAPLAQAPTAQTVRRMLTGKLNLPGDTPEILLSQPPAQYGTYQAEVYVNPGEAGTLMLRIVNLEDNSTLRLFSCPAQFSDNPAELFRHDYPGLMPELMRAYSVGHVPGLLPEKAPLFIIRPGEAHQFFGVACEVVFDPVAPSRPTRTLLRRCYRVQAYEDTHAPAPPPAEPAPAPAEQSQPTAPQAPTAAATPAPEPALPAPQEPPAAATPPQPQQAPTPEPPSPAAPATPRLVIPPPSPLPAPAEPSLFTLPPQLNPLKLIEAY